MSLVDVLPVLRKHATTALLTLSAAGAGAIMQHEGIVNTAYRDPVGVVTICSGHTKTARIGQVKTDAQCQALLLQDVAKAEHDVQRLVKVRLTQNQFDALVSFDFNVGEGNFAKSTLLKELNLGRCWAAGREFPKWDKAKGYRLPGLTQRRADERKLFETGCIKPGLAA
jgi:lysozyme